MRAVERIDELVYARIDAAGGGDSILDLLKASGATREELRDQLVTLLAAGHETTATALAWALERLARHPRTDLGDDAHIDAAVKEVLQNPPGALDHRPQDPQALRAPRLHPPARRVRGRLPLPRPPPRRDRLQPGTLPRRSGSESAPASTLEPFSYVPFGGGTRRCLGAAFATLEMREVVRAVHQRFTLEPDRPRGRADAPPQRHPCAAPRGLDHPNDPLA